MKRFENQELVMLLALCMVVLVVMFGATVAWFSIDSEATIGSSEITVDYMSDLDVWVKVENNQTDTGSENPADENIDSDGYVKIGKVGTGDNVVYSIDMNIVEQDNIAEHTIAPGAYGEVKFKIKSNTNLIKGYRIHIDPKIKAATGINIPSEDELMNIVTSHIKFYAKYEEVAPENSEKVYKNPILYQSECIFKDDYVYNDPNSGKTFLQDSYTEDNAGYVYRYGLSGEILEEETKEITLYWYWPYEYVDVPACLEMLDGDSIFYDEFKKYETKSDSERIEVYDWDDTYIGNYITNLVFHFDVETIR